MNSPAVGFADANRRRKDELMPAKCTWISHEFFVYDPKHGIAWNDVSGLYIFTGLNERIRWVALYIGQTDSFKERMLPHERWEEAVLIGATHVHAMAVPLAASRDRIEEELIQAYQPSLNVHFR
jgi:hypothetical protein